MLFKNIFHGACSTAGPLLGRELARLWLPVLGREPLLVTNGSPTGCFLETSFMGLVQLLGLFWGGSSLDYGCQFWDGSQFLQLTDRHQDAFKNIFHGACSTAGSLLGRELARLRLPVLGREPGLGSNGSPTGCFLKAICYN